MHRSTATWGHMVLGLVALIPSGNGCGPRIPYREQPPAEARIQKLAGLCSTYAARNQKRPTSIEELKAWVKKLDRTEFARLGIEDPDRAFVSPRDQQPYVLVRSAGWDRKAIVAYEQIGEAGKHYIVTPLGQAFELEDAELKPRVPSAQ